MRAGETGTARRPGRWAAGIVGLTLLAVTASGCAMGPWGSGSGEQEPGTGASSGPTASGSRPAPPATPAPAATTADAACTAKASSMSLSAQVQTLYMGAITQSSQSGAANELGQQMVGSVILMTDPGGMDMSSAQSLTGALRAQDPEILVAADQEGGQVTRLSGSGFTQIPSAVEQAGTSAEQITADWSTWAGELKQAGVDYDLAPVADVVTEDMSAKNPPIGQLDRGYGQTATDVTTRAGAAIEGMHSANVRTSVKHFPGLGEVTANTDDAVAVDSTTTADSESVTVFTELASSTDSIMVSSAIYQQIDPDNPAMFSSVIVTDLLRGTLGYGGVIISDDLGSAGSLKDFPVAERGTRFLRAGGDLALDVDPSTVNSMVQDTVQAAKGDQGFASQITDKAARVLTLKQNAGALSCG